MAKSNFDDFRLDGSNDFNNDMFKTWGLIGLFGIADSMKKRTDIEEEKLMLEKAQAMDDMSIYEDYIRQKEERNRVAAENRKIGAVVAVIITIIFLVFIFLVAIS